jgi:AcrR family transcriptional regulator
MRPEPMAAKRGKAKKPSLTAEKIRDEALRLIEKEGLEAFSTRKLGRALGCEAMAIYWYYPSKEALLDAVVDVLISHLTPPQGEASTDWIDAFRKLAFAYRGLAHEYPNAFPLLATRRFATEGTYRFLDSLFALARAQGVEPRTLASYFRILSSYCSGIALDELAGLDAREVPRDAKINALYPHLAEVDEWLQPAHFDDVFAFGLELLLESLEKGPRTPKRAARARS